VISQVVLDVASKSFSNHPHQPQTHLQLTIAGTLNVPFVITSTGHRILQSQPEVRRQVPESSPKLSCLSLISQVERLC